MRKKTCHKCEYEKPITEFHKDSMKSDGYRSECKECRRKIYPWNGANNKNEIVSKNKYVKNRISEEILEFADDNGYELFEAVIEYSREQIKKKYNNALWTDEMQAELTDSMLDMASYLNDDIVGEITEDANDIRVINRKPVEIADENLHYIGKKRCKDCNEVKFQDNFAFGHKRCKPCLKIYNRERSKKHYNPEKAKARYERKKRESIRGKCKDIYEKDIEVQSLWKDEIAFYQSVKKKFKKALKYYDKYYGKGEL